MLAVRLFVSVERRHVGVAQGGEKLGFALETIEPRRILRELLGKDLESDVASELGIPRAVYLSHAAFADGLNDLVRS